MKRRLLGIDFFLRNCQLIFSALTVSALVIVAGTQSVVAIGINDSNLPFKNFYRAHNDPAGEGSCPGGGVRMLKNWPSPLNGPTVDLQQGTLNLAPGQSTVDLQFNLLGHNCSRNIHPTGDLNDISGDLNDRNTLRSRAHITGFSSSHGEVAVVNIGDNATIDWRAHSKPQTSQDYFYIKNPSNQQPVNIPFRLQNLPSGNYTVTVTFNTKWVVQYNPGTHHTRAPYVCADPDTQIVSDINHFQPCLNRAITFSMNVNIPATGNARLNIATSGLPNGTSVTLNSVHHSVGNCSSAPGQAFTAVAGTTRQCTSGEGNGIGSPNGLGVYVQSISPAAHQDYKFSHWTSSGAGSCSSGRPSSPPAGALSGSRCVNLHPQNPTNQGTITAHFVPREFSITTNITGRAEGCVEPGETLNFRATATNNGPEQSQLITLGRQLENRDATGTASASSPASWSVGRLNSGSSQSRDFTVTVNANAGDSDRFRVRSWASPRSHTNSSRINSGWRNYVVCRNFDMRADLTAPVANDEFDELSGSIGISALLRNRHRVVDGMATHHNGTNYPLIASIRVTEGSQFITPLQGNQSTNKLRPATQVNNYHIQWSYTGSSNSNQHFTLFNLTSDQDRIGATTTVREGLDLSSPGRVCFEARITPRHKPPSSPANHSTTRCIWVHQVDGPYVTTEGLDVHAGAVSVRPQDVCSPDSSVWPTSHVRGRISPPRGSRSTYAVSATGNIINFGSANNVSGASSNLLKFSNEVPAGSYSAICRPDLTNREYYERLGFEVVDWTGSMTAMFAQLNNPGVGSIGNNKVIFINGDRTIPAGGLELARGRHITIVVTGNLRVSGNISMQPGPYTDRSAIPSLALVVGGDIDIDRTVTNIAGYISSNGTVDTCGNVANIAADGQASRCNARLNIRGALTANSVLFRRTFGSVRTTAAAETITFAPELYLSPPPGLFGVTNSIFVQTQIRERLPFF